MSEYVARNPHLRIISNYLDEDGAFLLQQLDDRRKYHVDNISIIELLDYADPWVEYNELVNYLICQHDVSTEVAEAILKQVRERNLLVPQEAPYTKEVTAAAEWRQSGWSEAYEFQKFIEDYPALDYSDHEEAVEAERELLDSFLDTEPLPPHAKSYPNCDRVSLPDATPDSDITIPGGIVDAEELESVRITDPVIGTCRSVFEQATVDPSLSRETLGTLLDLTFGFVGVADTPKQDELPLRTSPSGGSRQPTEAYPIIGDWPEVDPGTYHYDPKDNALEKLTERHQLLDCAANRASPAFRPRAALVLTSVVKRNMWKYRGAKTFQIIMLDIGHLLGTVQLVGGALGLESVVTRDVDEARVSNVLGIDRFEEPIYGVVLLGTQTETSTE